MFSSLKPTRSRCDLVETTQYLWSYDALYHMVTCSFETSKTSLILYKYELFYRPPNGTLSLLIRFKPTDLEF